jgi:hypothetical protein
MNRLIAACPVQAWCWLPFSTVNSRVKCEVTKSPGVQGNTGQQVGAQTEP